ncbi:MAG: MmgE/PrpD family protein [Rhodospirillales bacterium]|nr:MmgE/PrpD family protein [Rhodospirillales bacterium]
MTAAPESIAKTIAGELARRIVAMRYGDLPEQAIRWAKIGILDTVGVTLAGSVEDCVRIVAGVEGIGAAQGSSLVFGTNRRVPALDAALINGTASHALDFDDVGESIGGHPSVPLVSAIMALGEQVDAGGKDAILAYVVGFETESRIARAVHPYHYDRGWHPTTTVGVFGTVAAAARILKLGEAETAMALNLATSLAAGVKANFGTMTKPLHVGHSARSGVLAALLAKGGFTAGKRAFEHPQGYFNVFNGAGNYDAAKVFKHWADPLDIVEPGFGLKQYPCCGSTHPAIDAVLKLRCEQNINADDVTAIEVLTNPRRLPHTDKPEPRNGLEGKFSIQYVTLRALLDGRVVLSHFEDVAVRDPCIRKLLPLVRAGAHPEMPADSKEQFAAEVVVTTRAGKKLSARVPHQICRGLANPMSREELWAKFEDCALRALAPAQARPLFEMLERLDGVVSVRDLTDAIAVRRDAFPRMERTKVG